MAVWLGTGKGVAMATIVVAPARLFRPADPITTDTEIFGDTSGELAGRAAGQTFIYATARFASIAFGDAEALVGRGLGGDDRFDVTGLGEDGFVRIYGDGLALLDRARGGDDLLRAEGTIVAVGDADGMEGRSRGGDDRIVARDALGALGDALGLYGHARGGDDRITVYGGDGALGDASVLAERSVGGDDVLRVLRGTDFLAGDGLELYDHSRGGRDLLIGSRQDDVLIGDAATAALDRSICGNDVLKGGRGDDILYGDAPQIDADVTVGSDRFVFQARSGADLIADFQQGHDKIDVRQLGYEGFGELRISRDGTDSVVQFRGANEVTVQDVARLTAGDFLFA